MNASFSMAWGGGNTAAKDFYKLKKEYPNEYDNAVSKVVMYNIWYQDNAGNYIEKYYPEVTILYSDAFNKKWAYRVQTNTIDFVTNGVKTNHGPLGALYPQKYISEGDLPTFLYTIYNGLRNYEDPTYGGWGGRFLKLDYFKNGFTYAKDEGDSTKQLNSGSSRQTTISKRGWAGVLPKNTALQYMLLSLDLRERLTLQPGQGKKLNSARRALKSRMGIRQLTNGSNTMMPALMTD